MNIRNHRPVEVAIPRIYEGPAAEREGVVTIPFAGGPKQLQRVDILVDGEPLVARLAPISGYSKIERPFLQATILPG